MRGVTSTMLHLARQTRASGKSMAPIPLEKLDELAEYLLKVDKLAIAAESFVACAGEPQVDAVWTADEAEGLGYLIDALREVQS